MRKFLAFLPPFLLILAFLGSGFWVGNHPQYYQKYLDLYKSEILFYVPPGNDLFPVAFQKEIQRNSNVKVRFITTDPEAADILLVDQDYLLKKRTEVARSQRDPTDWETQFKMISPDFQRDLYKESQSLPLLWSMESGRLQILSLVVDSDTNRASMLWKFVGYLLSDPIYLRWLTYQKWNTTLLKFDEGTLTESRKASAIRKYNLNSLGISN